MCGSSSRTFSPSRIPPPTKQEREMRGSSSRTFLSACPILLRMRQYRERRVLRTLHSLPLAYPLPQTGERMCGSSNRRFSLPVAYHFPRHGERTCGSKNRMFSASRAPFPTENVRFFEPHILCLLYTVSCEAGERTCGSRNRTFSSCRVPSPTNQEREREVLRTSRSRPVAYNLP